MSVLFCEWNDFCFHCFLHLTSCSTPTHSVLLTPPGCTIRHSLIYHLFLLSVVRDSRRSLQSCGGYDDISWVFSCRNTISKNWCVERELYIGLVVCCGRRCTVEHFIVFWRLRGHTLRVGEKRGAMRGSRVGECRVEAREGCWGIIHWRIECVVVRAHIC